LILLLLYGDCYFPEVTQPGAGNSWSSEISIGGEEAAGKNFILSLVDIGPGGVIALKRYNDAESASGSASGICNRQDLTKSYEATFLAAVQVKRA
jgi:hypothetical protein